MNRQSASPIGGLTLAGKITIGGRHTLMRNLLICLSTLSLLSAAAISSAQFAPLPPDLLEKAAKADAKPAEKPLTSSILVATQISHELQTDSTWGGLIAGDFQVGGHTSVGFFYLDSPQTGGTAELKWSNVHAQYYLNSGPDSAIAVGLGYHHLDNSATTEDRAELFLETSNAISPGSPVTLGLHFGVLPKIGNDGIDSRPNDKYWTSFGVSAGYAFNPAFSVDVSYWAVTGTSLQTWARTAVGVTYHF